MYLCRILIVLATAALITSCGVTPDKVDHQLGDLDGRLLAIETVLVAPPFVTIVHQHWGRKQTRFGERESELKPILLAIARRELAEAGYSVVRVDIEGLAQNDSELARFIDEIDLALKETTTELLKTASAAGLEELTPTQLKALYTKVGRPASALARRAGADATLLLHYVGYEKTDGRIATETSAVIVTTLLGNPISVSPSRDGALETALIDAKAADLLWIDTYGTDGIYSIDQIAEFSLSLLPQDIDPLIGLERAGALLDDEPPPGGEERIRWLSLQLMIGGPDQVSLAASEIRATYLRYGALLDASHRSLLQNRSRAESDPAWLEPLKELIAILAESGNTHYYPTLERIAGATGNKELAEFARSAAARLIQTPGDEDCTDQTLPCHLQ